MIIPETLSGQRIRRCSDGSYQIARHSAHVEKWLDERLVRCPNELRWLPKGTIMAMDGIRCLFEGKTTYIVGKGPSLDRLTANDFLDGCPVICINESIHAIEALSLDCPTFLIQQDAALCDTCKPKRAHIFAPRHVKHWYHDRVVYEYASQMFGLIANEISVVCAIEIAKFLGAGSLLFMAMDAMTLGDTRYASSINYSPTKGGDPMRFVNHRVKVEHHSYPLSYAFITPRHPETQ